jgi:hypothetical protein
MSPEMSLWFVSSGFFIGLRCLAAGIEAALVVVVVFLGVAAGQCVEQKVSTIRSKVLNLPMQVSINLLAQDLAGALRKLSDYVDQALLDFGTFEADAVGKTELRKDEDLEEEE